MDLSKGAAFHESIAATWSKGYSRNVFKRRLLYFSRIFDREVKAEQHWLDLGCGSGVLTVELLQRGAIVTAVDGSNAMLNEAKKSAYSFPADRVEYIESDVTLLGMIDDCSFDGLLCSSVIEYLDNPNLLLQEAFRVLRTNGTLILSLPPKGSVIRTVQKIIRWGASFFGLEKFTYLSVSTFEVNLENISHWVDGSGFSVERITPFDPLIPRAFFRFVKPSLVIIEARKCRETNQEIPSSTGGN